MCSKTVSCICIEKDELCSIWSEHTCYFVSMYAMSCRHLLQKLMVLAPVLCLLLLPSHPSTHPHTINTPSLRARLHGKMNGLLGEWRQVCQEAKAGQAGGELRFLDYAVSTQEACAELAEQGYVGNGAAMGKVLAWANTGPPTHVFYGTEPSSAVGMPPTQVAMREQLYATIATPNPMHRVNGDSRSEEVFSSLDMAVRLQVEESVAKRRKTEYNVARTIAGEAARSTAERLPSMVQTELLALRERKAKEWRHKGRLWSNIAHQAARLPQQKGPDLKSGSLCGTGMHLVQLTVGEQALQVVRVKYFFMLKLLNLTEAYTDKAGFEVFTVSLDEQLVARCHKAAMFAATGIAMQRQKVIKCYEGVANRWYSSNIPTDVRGVPAKEFATLLRFKSVATKTQTRIASRLAQDYTARRNTVLVTPPGTGARTAVMCHLLERTVTSPSGKSPHIVVAPEGNILAWVEAAKFRLPEAAVYAQVCVLTKVGRETDDFAVEFHKMLDTPIQQLRTSRRSGVGTTTLSSIITALTNLVLVTPDVFEELAVKCFLGSYPFDSLVIDHKVYSLSDPMHGIESLLYQARLQFRHRVLLIGQDPAHIASVDFSWAISQMMAPRFFGPVMYYLTADVGELSLSTAFRRLPNNKKTKYMPGRLKTIAREARLVRERGEEGRSGQGLFYRLMSLAFLREWLGCGQDVAPASFAEMVCRPDEARLVADRFLQVIGPNVARYRSTVMGSGKVLEFGVRCPLSAMQSRVVCLLAGLLSEKERAIRASVQGEMERVAREEGQSQLGALGVDRKAHHNHLRHRLSEQAEQSSLQYFVCVLNLMTRFSVHPSLVGAFSQPLTSSLRPEDSEEDRAKWSRRSSGVLATLHLLILELQSRIETTFVHRVFVFCRRKESYDMLQWYLREDAEMKALFGGSSRCSFASHCGDDGANRDAFESFVGATRGMSLLVSYGVVPFMDHTLTDSLITFDCHKECPELTNLLGTMRRVGDEFMMRLIMLLPMQNEAVSLMDDEREMCLAHSAQIAATQLRAACGEQDDTEEENDAKASRENSAVGHTVRKMIAKGFSKTLSRAVREQVKTLESAFEKYPSGSKLDHRLDTEQIDRFDLTTERNDAPTVVPLLSLAECHPLLQGAKEAGVDAIKQLIPGVEGMRISVDESGAMPSLENDDDFQLLTCGVPSAVATLSIPIPGEKEEEEGVEEEEEGFSKK